MQEEIKKNLLGVAAITNYEKYLGLPSFVGRGKKNKASVILEKGFGTKCMVGKKGYCHKVEEKS